MGRIRSAGLVKRGEVWHIDKTIGGKRLCESTGERELEKAELYLVMRMERARRARRSQGRKTKTINLALGTVRHLLNMAASEWQDECGLTWLERQVRVHDLKHTFGRRLRAAGVSFEDRQDLLGHRSGRITTHYSAAELGNLLTAANLAGC